MADVVVVLFFDVQFVIVVAGVAIDVGTIVALSDDVDGNGDSANVDAEDNDDVVVVDVAGIVVVVVVESPPIQPQ